MIYTLGPPTTLTCESTDRFPYQIRTLNVARTTVTVTGGGADNTTIHQNMSKIRVCVRFRPLNSTEKKQFDGKLCVKELDDESFLFNVCFSIHLTAIISSLSFKSLSILFSF